MVFVLDARSCMILLLLVLYLCTECPNFIQKIFYTVEFVSVCIIWIDLHSLCLYCVAINFLFEIFQKSRLTMSKNALAEYEVSLKSQS